MVGLGQRSDLNSPPKVLLEPAPEPDGSVTKEVQLGLSLLLSPCIAITQSQRLEDPWARPPEATSIRRLMAGSILALLPGSYPACCYFFPLSLLAGSTVFVRRDVVCRQETTVAAREILRPHDLVL